MKPLPPYQDEVLAIVHLLGERRYHMNVEAEVAQAIKILAEIRRQLQRRDEEETAKEIDLQRRVRQ